MNPDTSITDLLRDLRDDTARLLRDEVALAKTEVREITTRTARNVASIALGGAVVLAGSLVLLIGLAQWLTGVFLEHGMSAGSSALSGFLIIAVLVIATGAALLAKGRKAMAASSLTPSRTARSLQEDKQWAKEKLS